MYDLHIRGTISIDYQYVKMGIWFHYVWKRTKVHVSSPISRLGLLSKFVMVYSIEWKLNLGLINSWKYKIMHFKSRQQSNKYKNPLENQIKFNINQLKKLQLSK